MAGIWDELEKHAPSKTVSRSVWDELETGVPQRKANKPGLLSDVKRGVGQMVGSAGATMQDLGAERMGTAMEDWGDQVARNNPSEINSAADIIDKPFTTAREAVGEVVPQVGSSLGAGMVGRGIGGVLGGALGSVIPGIGTAGGAVAGQWLGGAIGGLAPIAMQEYGGIRKEQREQGIDDKTRALMAAAPATALEMFGPEAVANKIARKGLKAVAKDIGEQGAWKFAGKEALKTGIVEGPLTEVPQSALERWGAYKSLTGQEAWDDYAVSGVKGFFGGAAAGGAMSPLKRASPTINDKTAETDLIKNKPLGIDRQMSLLGPEHDVGEYSPLVGTQKAVDPQHIAELDDYIFRAKALMDQAARAAKNATTDEERITRTQEFYNLQDLIAPVEAERAKYRPIESAHDADNLTGDLFATPKAPQLTAPPETTTTAAPAVAPPTSTSIDQTVADAAAAQGLPLTDSKGRPVAKRVELFTKAMELAGVGAIDPQMLKETMMALAKNRYAEVSVALTQADTDFAAKKAQSQRMQPRRVAAEPGVTNVSTDVPSQPAVAPSMESGSPVVPGSVVDTGPVVTEQGAVGGNAVGANPTNQQTVVPPVTGGEPAPAVARPKLTLKRPGQKPLSLEDSAAVAEATGNVGEEQAQLDDEDATRRLEDFEVLDAKGRLDTIKSILTERFANAKDAARNTEIALAYLTAMRSAPQDSKVKVQGVIGKKFGITPEAVRKHGNTTAIVEAGVRMGYSEGFVRELLGVDDNTKAAPEKVTAENAADVAQKEDRKQTADKPNVTSALKEAGVESPEGADDGFGMDTSNSWKQGDARKGIGDTANAKDEGLNNAIVSAMEAMEELQNLISEYEQTGQTDLIEGVQKLIEAEQAKLEKLIASATKHYEKAAATKSKKVEKEQKGATKESKGKAKKAKAAPAAAAVDEDLSKTGMERASDAWNEVADSIDPSFPRFEDLSADDQRTFVDFGSENWTRQDVVAFAQQTGGDFVAAEDAKFGKDGYDVKVKNSYTAAGLVAELKSWLQFYTLGDKLVVVNTIDDLLYSEDRAARVAGAKMYQEKAYGGVMGGRAYLVADRIAKGTGKAKFIHEVGSHLGLENILGEADYKQLTNQVVEWARANNDSQESVLARRAAERVMNAGTVQEDKRQELLAYFLEEALDAGVKPSATTAPKNPLRAWLDKVIGAFRAAVAKLGLKPEALTTQDLVDMAYGAAHIALRAGAPRVKTPTMRFGKASDAAREYARRVSGATGVQIVDDALDAVKKLASSMTFLHDIVDKAKAQMPAVTDWYKAMQDTLVTRTKYEQEAEAIADMAGKLKNGTQRVNAFLSDSTFEQKWGYDPQFPGRTVTVDKTMAAKFDALTKDEQDVVRAVFAHGEKMLAEKRRILKALGIDKAFSFGGSLEGPYAPLMRFGNYLAVLKSQALVDAEAAKDDDLVAQLKRNPADYLISSFDTMGQARRFAEENAAKYAFTDAFTKSERITEDPMSMNQLEKVLAAMRADKNIDPTAKKALESMVQQMYFQSVDEHHARTHGLQRKNRAGYDADMMRAFLAKARAEAGFLANMKHGATVNEHFYEMQRQTKGPGGKRDFQDTFNLLAKHYAESINPPETPIQDRLMAFTSAWQLVTSVGYHVANATQPFLVTVPKLAADFANYTGAWNAVLAGYSTIKQTGLRGKIDLSNVKDAGLRGALQRAADMRVLDVGMDNDLTQFDAFRTGYGAMDKSSAVVRSALQKLRQVSRMVETANRVASATAAYKMAIDNKQTVEQAQDYAVQILQTTQGDSSRMGAPLMLKKLPKMVTQYKKFQFMMASLYAKAFQDAFFSADAKTKAVGRRMLAYKLTHTAIASGALGLPLMNMVAAVFSAMGGDDEPQDLERYLREAIDDDDLADILLRGPLSLVGLDMGSKLGDNNVFAIMPYGDWDFTSSAATAKTLMGLMGPAASQVGRMAEGVGYMHRGDYYRGVEQMMPKGVADAMKVFRIENTGYQLKNGDVMFKTDDVNDLAMAAAALGMPTAALRRMDWLRSQQYEISRFYVEKTKDIQRDYIRAYEDGDHDTKRELEDKWMDMQDAKDHLRKYFNDNPKFLVRQPLSNLIRSPFRKELREERLQDSARS